MKQAYFTFCCTGSEKSVSGQGGDRARAITKGSFENDLTPYKNYCSYPQFNTATLPQNGTDENYDNGKYNLRQPPDNTFARLVCGKVHNGIKDGTFLAHSVYATPDKETNREGNYFSHLIFPRPDSWSVRNAIEMWGSPFWVTQDDDSISTRLEECDESSIQPGYINQNSFVEFLRSSPEHQRKFSFLLKSWLYRSPNGKVILTGLPEDATFCLWGLVRCLPSSMWKNISFSTFEKPTILLTFDITNFFSLNDFNEQDYCVLNDLKYHPNTILYSETENRSLENSKQDFSLVDDILELAVNDSFSVLDEFYASVPPEWKCNSFALQLFWKFANYKGPISDNDIAEAIRIPELKPRVVETLMDSNRFTIDAQIPFYDELDKEQQDIIIKRIMSENSVAQIRNNRTYADLVISALQNPVKQDNTQPLQKHSLLRKIWELLRKIWELLNTKIF